MSELAALAEIGADFSGILGGNILSAFQLGWDLEGMLDPYIRDALKRGKIALDGLLYRSQAEVPAGVHAPSGWDSCGACSGWSPTTQGTFLGMAYRYQYGVGASICTSACYNVGYGPNSPSAGDNIADEIWSWLGINWRGNIWYYPSGSPTEYPEYNPNPTPGQAAPLPLEVPTPQIYPDPLIDPLSEPLREFVDQAPWLVRDWKVVYEVTPAGVAVVESAPLAPPKPPEKGVRERKSYVSIGHAAYWAVNAITETNDAVTALYKGLPLHLQKRNAKFFDKVLAIWDNIGTIPSENVEKMLVNLIANELQDAFYGMAGVALRKGVRAAWQGGYYPRAVGLQAGDRYRPGVPPSIAKQADGWGGYGLTDLVGAAVDKFW